MLSTNPYLHFNGNTAEAMNFYRSALGGEFTIYQRFKDIPGGERMPANEQDKILHISLTVNDSVTIMATDALESMGQSAITGSNFHINIHTESEKETDTLFANLSTGGKVEMPLNKTLWGAYFGMCCDKFGVQWMIGYTYPKQ